MAKDLGAPILNFFFLVCVSAGNVREGGFWPPWDGAALLRSLRNPALLKGRCGGCEFQALCGGCRARAFN